MAADAAAALERHRLSGPPPHDLSDIYLIPDYITPVEEASLIRQIATSQQAWVQLSGRRLQNHGGAVHAKGFLLPAPMPAWLSALTPRVAGDVPPLAEAGGPNHVLVNAYRPGEGIMPHSDGPLYAPVVCILSLGSPCVIRFWTKQEEGGAGGRPPRVSAALPPRSLLVFTGDAYETCLHGIEEVAAERLDCSVLNPGAAAGAAAAGAAAAGGAGFGGGADEAAAERVDCSVLSPSMAAGCSGGGGACSGGGGGCCGGSGSGGGGGCGGGCGGGGGGGGSDGTVDSRDCGCGRGSSGPAWDSQPPAAAAAAGPAPGRVEGPSALGAADGAGAAAGCACGGGGGGGSMPRTGERFSLTIRRVLKVHKGLRLPGAR